MWKSLVTLTDSNILIKRAIDVHIHSKFIHTFLNIVNTYISTMNSKLSTSQQYNISKKLFIQIN